MSRITFSVIVATVAFSLQVHAQDISGTGSDRVYEQTYHVEVQGHDTVFFEDMGGSMEISSTAESQLSIWQAIPVGDRSRRDAIEWGLEFELEISIQDGRLEVEAPGVPRGTMYEIRVPEGLSVDLETDYGEIEASGIDGNVTIQHGGGSMEIEQVAGFVTIRSDGGVIEASDVEGAVTIQSDGGGVSVSRAGNAVIIATGGGGVEVDDVDGDVSITTAGGNVEIENIRGNLRAVTSAGNMEVADVTGSALLSNGGGSIDVNRVGGELTATTSGGDVEADDVGGAIQIETMAGDVDLSGVKAALRVISEVGDIDIEVDSADFLENDRIEIDLGYGDIDLLLPRNTDADVVANVQESGGIDISNERWDIEVLRARSRSDQAQSRRAELRIGDGGGLIQIRLLSGEITIDNE